jgi:polyisoprenoid-binding protein YceI
MNRLFLASVLSVSLTLAACSPAGSEGTPLAEGDWKLDGAASELSYVTIKADEIAETNTFEGLSGGVTADGAANISIDLASVSTGVDIRDERMRDVFFVVADNPEASITAQIDPASFEGLAIGESVDTPLEGTIALKGAEVGFQADISVTRVSDNRVLAVSDKPVIVSAGQFGLTDGLAELQSLAELPSITPVVPVTFSLTFERP